MKTYKFELTVHEGNDEFWEILEKNHKSGCDEIRAMIKDLLTCDGQFVIGGEYENCQLKLIEFNDTLRYGR